MGLSVSVRHATVENATRLFPGQQTGECTTKPSDTKPCEAGSTACLENTASAQKNPARSSDSDTPRVALLFETTSAYAREQLHGVGDYIRRDGPWSVTLADLGANEPPPNWLEYWDGDGVIVRGESRRLAIAASRLGIPCVDLTPSRLLPHTPWVVSDDRAIAQLVARHYFDRGFEHFAFCGDDRFSWSSRREALFKSCVQQREHACAVFRATVPPFDNNAVIDDIARWLANLPTPVAVFAYCDSRGQQVIEACRRMRFSVPEQVAVVGVDNDEVLCTLSPPPLSSVVLNPRRAGWEAAALLDRMINGENLPSDTHLIPPIGIEARQSSDILAVADPKIAAALGFIHRHACEGIRVKDVLQHSPMARRTLENRFRKLIGRTPRQEILRVQLDRVRELLVGTAQPLWEIAGQTGIEPEYLSTVFRHATGMSPSDYRRRYGRGQ